MNKILIFAGARESELLIKKIINNYLNLAEFHIIYENEEIISSFKEKKENLYFYKINFLAYDLYKNLLYKNFNKIIVFIKHKQEAEFVLNKVKFSKSPILFVKFWINFENIPQKNSIEILDLPEIITNKIIDFLPGVPLYARDIGLGDGEIMEVEIPTLSPFAYKSPSYIENRYNVKVAAIYRQNELKQITQNTIILPNDKIILIGNPQTLKEIYTQIRKNIGSFPQPYGQNLYLLIDMKHMEKKEISELLKSSLFLHRKLKHKKLIISIINPSLSVKLYKLYKFSNIEINTYYFIDNYEKALIKDTNELNIGLVITNNKFFKNYSKTFFNIKKPIFKKGEESIKKCTNITVIINKNNIKNIISTIFDLSYQLGIKLRILNADPENPNKDIVEYIRYLAKLFNFNNIEFSATKENPIIKLNKEKNLCLIEAFEKPPVNIIKQILMPKIEYSYLLLQKFNQFLIPVKDTHES